MSGPGLEKDLDADRLALMQKLSDKGIGELVEEICDLKGRLAMEAKHRRDLIDSVRRLTDEKASSGPGWHSPPGNAAILKPSLRSA